MSNASDRTTSLHRRNIKLAALSADSKGLNSHLFKLRAVLILLAAPYGSKAETIRTVVAELREKLKISSRSLRRWKTNYLRFGFAGIPRRRRNDSGHPQGFDAALLVSIADASKHVRRYGDLARAFRNGSFQNDMSQETFRVWIRRAQRQLRVAEISKRRREEPDVSPR
jgi:hypothetical protein